jgi:hypothetical protein
VPQRSQCDCQSSIGVFTCVEAEIVVHAVVVILSFVSPCLTKTQSALTHLGRK